MHPLQGQDLYIQFREPVNKLLSSRHDRKKVPRCYGHARERVQRAEAEAGGREKVKGGVEKR